MKRENKKALLSQYSRPRQNSPKSRTKEKERRERKNKEGDTRGVHLVRRRQSAEDMGSYVLTATSSKAVEERAHLFCLRRAAIVQSGTFSAPSSSTSLLPFSFFSFFPLQQSLSSFFFFSIVSAIVIFCRISSRRNITMIQSCSDPWRPLRLCSGRYS